MIGSNSGEIKKIVLVTIVLIVLLLSAVIIKSQRQFSPIQKREIAKVNKVTVIPSPTAFETPGVYSINLDSTSVKSGDTVTAEINFFASEKILDGSDVILKFDPLFLTPYESIVKGDFFNIYPVMKVDSQKGVIKVSGFEAKSKSGMTNPSTLFTVKFTAQKPGETTLSFDFQKGKTNKTTLVESKTSRNILGEASSAVLQIE